MTCSQSSGHLGRTAKLKARRRPPVAAARQLGRAANMAIPRFGLTTPRPTLQGERRYAAARSVDHWALRTLENTHPLNKSGQRLSIPWAGSVRVKAQARSPNDTATKTPAATSPLNPENGSARIAAGRGYLK